MTRVMPPTTQDNPSTVVGSVSMPSSTSTSTSASAPVLLADRLSRVYPVRTGLFGRQEVKALDRVSFSLARGKTLGVVGESGCGKSTLARQLTMIETPSDGILQIDGETVFEAGKARAIARDRALRQRVQMVFQNPFASLNPRKTIEQTLAEPLAINTSMSRAERIERVGEMVDTVGLRTEYLRRYPHMFSGGQRQRVAIARAMIVEPGIVVADEPTSALDVSVQAQILNLFLDLQERFGTSYVFISHNLSVVEHIAHDLMVMYLGAAVELGDTARIFARPRHPYTRALMSATPSLLRKGQDGERKVRIVLQGELPSPLAPPPGCTFHRRCPYVVERCRHEAPVLRDVDGRQVACHRAEDVDA